MGDILYFGILLAAALLQIAFLTLIVLVVYRLLVSKQISTKQAVSVFAWVTLVNSTIAIMSYYDTNVKPLTLIHFVIYLLAIIGAGLLVARLTREKHVG